MLERPNRRDWKSRRGAISSWVQIPSSPPTLKTPSALLAARLSMQYLHLFATLSVRRTPTCRERAVAEAMKASKIVSTYLVKPALAVAVLVGLLACVPDAATGEGRLRLATTTSLYDTGLWDTLERRFEDRYDVELDILTGGTGKALEFGRLGEVDAIAIHDRVREEAFVADGYGVERYPIAYNYFMIVGPESDPAGISKLAPEEALLEVMRRGQGSGDRVWFVSRGDESGTHAREKLLWEKAGYDYDTVRDSGDWYLESGAGMGAVLLLADEKDAYTLTDAGTFLAFRKDLDLTPLVESGDSLLNVYSVIAVSPERFPDANSDMADRLIQFLISEEVQDLIAAHGVSDYGRALFTPTRGQEPQ